MAKRNEFPVTGATAAPEGVLAEAAGNPTPAAETATAAPEAAQSDNNAQVQALPLADPTVEPDDTDKAAAGSWDEVGDDTSDEDQLIDGTPICLRQFLTVTHKNGIYLRIGPGKNFEPRRVLPAGSLVSPVYVPDYAKVPGWLCVAVASDDGEDPVIGWVDETLVAAAAG